MPHHCVPSSLILSFHMFIIYNVDGVYVVEHPFLQLFLNLAQFPQSPASRGCRVKNPPITSFGIDIMNPLHPKRLFPHSNMPNHFSNCNPIPKFQVTNAQTIIFLWRADSGPTNITRLTSITKTKPKKRPADGIDVINYFLRKHKQLAPTCRNPHKN